MLINQGSKVPRDVFWSGLRSFWFSGQELSTGCSWWSWQGLCDGLHHPAVFSCQTVECQTSATASQGSCRRLCLPFASPHPLSWLAHPGIQKDKLLWVVEGDIQAWDKQGAAEGCLQITVSRPLQVWHAEHSKPRMLFWLCRMHITAADKTPSTLPISLLLGISLACRSWSCLST